MIYFLKPIEFNGPIKIGFTDNPKTRMYAANAASPFELEILAMFEGGRNTERYVHEMFKEFRKRLDWFEPDEKLLKFIEDCKISGKIIDLEDDCYYRFYDQNLAKKVFEMRNSGKKFKDIGIFFSFSKQRAHQIYKKYKMSIDEFCSNGT